MHCHTSHYLGGRGGSGNGGGDCTCSLGSLWTAERVLLPPTASVLRMIRAVKTGLPQLWSHMSLSKTIISWKKAFALGFQQIPVKQNVVDTRNRVTISFLKQNLSDKDRLKPPNWDCKIRATVKWQLYIIGMLALTTTKKKNTMHKQKQKSELAEGSLVYRELMRAKGGILKRRVMCVHTHLHRTVHKNKHLRLQDTRQIN